MGDVSMLKRRFVCARMDLVMLNFSFEFNTFLWDFDNQKFLMFVCLDRMRSVRCLCFPLKKTTFELNFSAMETVCCSATHVYFTHYVVRDRLGAIPRREATSRSVKIFRELFQVVHMIVTKSTCFVSVMIRVRSIVLMHVTS